MSDPQRPEYRDHKITVDDAQKMTKRHRSGTRKARGAKTKDGEHGGVFSKEAILKLLEQPGAEYMRFYYAKHDDGNPAVVLVASDANMQDMTSSESLVLDMHWPCPPYCSPGDGALNV